MKIPNWRASGAGFILFTLAAVITGYSAPGDLKWMFDAGGPIRSSPALGTNGLIIFGTLEGEIFALNPVNGGVRWTHSAEGRVLSSAAIGPDGTVFIGCRSGLLALDALRGEQRWFFRTNEVACSPTLDRDASLYFVTLAGEAFACDARSGIPRWNVKLFAELSVLSVCYASPVLGQNGSVFVGSADQPFFIGAPSQSSFAAFNPESGERIWTTNSINSIQSTAAIGEDGTLFVCGFDKEVYALDPATGARKWEHLTGDSISSSPALGPDGTLYVGANDGRLYALDTRTGAEKWNYLTGDSIHSSPAIAADGTVYFGSYDKSVYALDGKTGAKKWSFQTEDLVLSSPSIGPDGTVYIGSYDGKLYAFEGSAPLAESSWPMFKGNPRHTGDAIDSMPVRMMNPRLTEAGFAIDLAGKPGRVHHIEYQDALGSQTWVELLSPPITNRIQTVLDRTAVPVGTARFYRIRLD